MSITDTTAPHPVPSSCYNADYDLGRRLSPRRKILQLQNVSIKLESNSRDELGCEIVDLPRCGMVLFRQWEDGRDT